MFSYNELEQIDRFLSTLETCEYMGIPPRFDETTAVELRNILGIIQVELRDAIP